MTNGSSRKLFYSQNKNSISGAQSLRALPRNLAEHNEAIALANYLHFLKNMGKVKLYTHVPNETYTTSWNQRRKNAQAGVKKGIPDYIVVTEKDVIFIELKRVKGGVTSPEQKLWLLHLSGKKTHSYLAAGFEQAKAFLDPHL